MNSLRSKQIAAAVFSFLSGGAAGVAGSAYVADLPQKFTPALVLAVLFLLVELGILFLVKTDDEELLIHVKEHQTKNLQGMTERLAAVDARLKEEISNGNLESVVQWSDFRDKLR